MGRRCCLEHNNTGSLAHIAKRMAVDAAQGGINGRPRIFFFFKTSAAKHSRTRLAPAMPGIESLQVGAVWREGRGASEPGPGALGARTAP